MYETLIELGSRDGVRVIKIGNEVDIANADTMARYLDEAAAGTDTVVVSLQTCRYIDSTGLRPIVRLAERVGEGFFIVVPPGSQICRIFDSTGLRERLNVCDSLDEAVSRANACRQVAV